WRKKMDQEKLIKQLIEEVMKSMGTSNVSSSVAAKTADCCEQIDASNYPLGEKIPEQIKSPTGRKLSEITLDKLIKGEIGAADMRISPETLEMQAEVAESVKRDAFAGNLRRASELIAVPDER